jgi:hypothetical protein
VEFVVGKVALGQVSSEYFGFACQFAFDPQLHNHHPLSPGAGTVGQTVVAVPSGLKSHPLMMMMMMMIIIIINKVDNLTAICEPII